jgi:hypothetical protein
LLLIRDISLQRIKHRKISRTMIHWTEV